MALIHRSHGRLTLAALLVAASAACSSQGTGIGSGQIAARVNGNEISVHQVNYEFLRLPAERRRDAVAAQNAILAQLVRQQLLVQQAYAAELDRKPEVMLAIERAKQQVLAHAYLENMTAAATKPTRAEVERFVQEHPELFNNRRIYRFQQIELDKTTVSDDVRKYVDEKRTLDQVAALLKLRGSHYRTDAGVRRAEEFPLELLSTLASMRNGDTRILSNGDRAAIFHLIDSRDQPIAGDQAQTAAESYLLLRRKREYAQNEIKQLIDGARIEYLGQFAPQTPASDTSGTAQAGVLAGEEGRPLDEALR